MISDTVLELFQVKINLNINRKSKSKYYQQKSPNNQKESLMRKTRRKVMILRNQMS